MTTPTVVEVLIGQLVNLVKDGQPVRMSKRAGTVITLEDLVDAVGVDAARYALERSSIDSMLDIDLDLLTQRTNDNPVYYVQYAHARTCAVQRNLESIGEGALNAFAPELLDHEREVDLLGVLGEFPRVVASAAELRAPHRVARYLEDLAGRYHRWYDTDELPDHAEGRRADDRRQAHPGLAQRGHADRARQRPRPARRQRSGAHVSGRAHPAGPRHADVMHEEHPSAAPADLNALDPAIWPGTASRVDGVLNLGGQPVTELAAQYGTPALLLDEHDLRSRARAYVSAFDGADVYYAGKAFLCTAVARWIDDEGLGLDVCSGGELAVALAAGFPPERLAFHGNNKSVDELQRAVDAGVGRVVVDSFAEIDRLAEIASGLDGRSAFWCG